MYIAQKIELKIKKSQIEYLNQCFGYSRHIYNKALDTWKEIYSLYKEDNSNPKPSHRKVRDVLKGCKEEWEENLPKMILETACEDLGKAYNMMWKNVGKYPKYKSKHKSKSSFRIFRKDNYTIQIKDKKNLKLRGIDFFLKMKEPLKINGIIKEVTISNKGSKYYASFILDTNEESFQIENNLYCGIDLGIKDLAIINGDDGLFKKYHSIIKKLKPLYEKINYYNKLLSKKVKNSNKYNLTRTKLNNTYDRIVNIRNDYLHKITTNICTRYKNITIEDLKVSNLIKNKHLSKSIGNSCWYTFRKMLEYKSKMYNNTIIIADRFFPSTQLCSNCGHVFVKENKMTLKDRKYICPDCGKIIDRDFNASTNLKEYGRRFMSLANEGK